MIDRVTDRGEIDAALNRLRESKSFDDARRALGRILQLDAPAPVAVTARALADRKFATNLAALGRFPKWREALLTDPLNDRFLPPAGRQGDLGGVDTAEIIPLVRKAASAYARWGAAGAKTTDPWTQKRRRDACRSCDKYVERPKSAVYRLTSALSKGDDNICAACGCPAEKKILMATETCPIPSRDDPRLSRWGDPMASATDQPAVSAAPGSDS